MRWGILAVPMALLACAPSSRIVLAAPSQMDACRVASDGAPVPDARRAERGIGGTGGKMADRGIGGTGIGGTGIIGTITGFASICVNGMEVAFDPASPVQVDGVATPATSLRAGQLAVIAAQRTPLGLGATTITIRHEVVGPLARGADGALRVAGQRVVVPASAWVLGVQGSDASGLRDGQFVAVSGLRRPDGGIAVSRIDAAVPGATLVRGVLAGDAASPRIGELALRLRPGVEVPALHAVSVSGRYDGAVLEVDTVAVDLAMAMPTAAFVGAQHLSIESVVRLGVDRVTFADGETALRPARVASPASFDPATPTLAVVDLERGSDGAFSVAHLGEPPGLGPRAMPASANGDGARPSAGQGGRMPGDPPSGPSGDHGGAAPLH